MKAPILGLAVATVAFAGSSIYLWQQLSEGRVRAAQVEETARKLTARVAELEKARADFAQRRMPGSFMAGHFSANGSPPPGPSSAPSDDKQDALPDRPTWAVLHRDPPPALKRMMEAQVRASNRHLYADVGPKLGLNKEAATKLTDLLTEQQLANMNAMRGADSPEEAARRSEKLTQENEQAISDLIGPDKAQSLKEYQQTIPARMEVESLARQLEGNETALTAEQHQKLVDIYVAERARVPQPEYTDGMDNEEYAKAMTAWRDDYEKRTSAEASQVLNTEQFTAFNEIQQWQQEMRAQMPAGMQAGPMFRGGRAYVAPNLMFNTVVAAGPASVSAGGTSATAQPQKKP